MCNVATEGFDSFFRFAGECLVSLELEITGGPADIVGEAIAKYCRSLQRLKFTRCSMGNCVDGILNNCRALKYLSLERSFATIDAAAVQCPSLHTLIVDRGLLILDSTPTDLLTAVPFPALKMLEAEFFANRVHMLPVLVSGGELLSLSIKSIDFNWQDDLLQPLATSTPKLQHLCFRDYKVYYQEAIRTAIPLWRALQSVTLEGFFRHVYSWPSFLVTDSANAAVRAIRVVDGDYRSTDLLSMNFTTQTLTISGPPDTVTKRFNDLPECWRIHELYLDEKCSWLALSCHLGVVGPTWGLRVLEIGDFDCELYEGPVASLARLCKEGFQLKLRGRASAELRARYPAVSFVSYGAIVT
jgi:hypothetical protein